MQNKKKLSLEEIKKRAVFELEQIKSEETKSRVNALRYLEKICNEAEKLKRGIESPEFEVKRLHDESILTWIDQYSEYFKDYIKSANHYGQMQEDLEYTIQLVNPKEE